MDFSTRLKQFIKIGDIKLKELACSLNYDISYISKWVNGKMIPTSKISKEIIDKSSIFFSEKIIYLQKEEEIAKLTGRPFPLDTKYRVYKTIYSLLEDSYYISSDKSCGNKEGSSSDKVLIELEKEDIIENISNEIKNAIALSEEDVEIYCTLGKLKIIVDILNSFGSFFITKKIKVVIKSIVDETDYELFKHSELENIYDLISNIVFLDLEIYIKTICPYSGFIYIKDYSITNYNLNLLGTPITCFTTNEENILKEYDIICESIFKEKNLVMKSRNKYLFQDRIDEFFITEDLDEISAYISYLEGFFLTDILLEKLINRYNIIGREAYALRAIRNSYENILKRNGTKLFINISRKSLIRGFRQKRIVLSDKVFILTEEEYEEYMDSVKTFFKNYNDNINISIIDDRMFPINIYEYKLSIIATKSYVFLKKDPMYVDEYINGYFEILDREYSNQLFKKLKNLEKTNLIENIDLEDLNKYVMSVRELE